MKIMDGLQDKSHAAMLDNILGKKDLAKNKKTRSYLDDTVTTGCRGLARSLLNLKKGNARVSLQRHKKIENSVKILKRPNLLQDSKVARLAAYQDTKYNLGKWRSVVDKNRLSDQIVFPLDETTLQWSAPLEDEKLRQEAAVREAVKAKAADPTSSLSQNLSAKLFSLLYPEKLKNPHSKDDEMNLVEDCEIISQQAHERARLRAKQSYLEAKFKKQSKIKSKSYHRHLKRRRLKNYENETALLKEKDPEAFAERMLAVDKLRIEERASQRHRIGGKFAKKQRLRAKFDDEARDAVQSMIEKNKELTRKRELSSSSSSSDDDEVPLQRSEEDMEVSTSKNVENEQDVELKSEWTQVQKKKKASSKSKPTVVKSILNKVSIDAMLGNNSTDQSANDANFFERLEAVCEDDDLVGDIDCELAKDFAADKANVVNSETPANIDTFTPGWNSWTGPGMEAIEKRKRERMVLQAPKVMRKDEHKQRVIIRNEINEGLRKHLVKEIPFPYETPDQFESAVCKPIGREWNTESSFRDFTKKKTAVKSGRIIKPINKHCTLLGKKEFTNFS